MSAVPAPLADPGLGDLAHALERGRERDLPTAVLAVSVLGLGAVHAVRGRAEAEAVRGEVLSRLGRLARERDGSVVALGGGAVALICPGHDHDAAQEVADRAIETVTARALAAPLGVAVGLAVSEHSTDPADGLLRDAEIAATWASEQGPVTVAAFRPSMREELASRMRTVVDLGSALTQDDELFLQYQPVIDLSTRTIVAAEALVRWRHPRRGLISPAAFIPVAEETGMITELGRWVLDAAVEQLARWRPLMVAGFRVHVNLSPVELRQPRFVAQVTDTLAAHGVPPEALLLEITETAVMGRDEEPMARLESLREAGVALGIDDFGTGYSSVGYLRELPVDVIKLDRSLTAMVAATPDEYALTRAIVGLVRSSGLDVIAEGIEEHVQVAHLRAMRCRYGQGFLLARPADPERITQILQAG